MIGTTLSGRYRIDSKLGSGGMSTVYLARDETLERWVAIKILHAEISDQPDQLERFRNEARAVAQISHPNVVAVIDAGDDQGHPYIVFEYVEGETLKQRIDRLRRLPLDEATAYAIEVGRGLLSAHARGIVHRDVKPQNVLIDPEGRAKVTDFGIARTLNQKGLTATGRVLGTTDYVSPEQAMGHPVDARTDIYSLGVVLYESLIGRPPFAAETLVGVAMKHVNEPMPNVQTMRPGVSSVLASVVERATEKDPKRRYPDMTAMLDDLEGALEVEISRAGAATGEATAVLDSVPGPRRRIFTGRNVSVVGIFLVFLAGAAALLIAGLASEDEPSRNGPSDPQQVAVGEPLSLADGGATAFDPEGDDEEHSDEAPNAIDGDAETGWTTEEYVAPSIEDSVGKSGVGLIIDAGSEVTPSALEIESSDGGWTGELYAATDSQPEDLGGWGEPVAQIEAGEANKDVPLEGVTAQYFLIWITDGLSGAPGEYKVEIDEVRLFG